MSKKEEAVVSTMNKTISQIMNTSTDDRTSRKNAIVLERIKIKAQEKTLSLESLISEKEQELENYIAKGAENGNLSLDHIVDLRNDVIDAESAIEEIADLVENFLK